MSMQDCRYPPPPTASYNSIIQTIVHSPNPIAGSRSRRPPQDRPQPVVRPVLTFRTDGLPRFEHRDSIVPSSPVVMSSVDSGGDECPDSLETCRWI